MLLAAGRSQVRLMVGIGGPSSASTKAELPYDYCALSARVCFHAAAAT